MALTSFANDGWELEDVETHLRNYAGTFEPLPVEVRSSLQPGQHVKLAFRMAVGEGNQEAMERMWVAVTRRTATGYEGVLDNDARYADYMTAGAEVSFEARHVIQIWTEVTKQ